MKGALAFYIVSETHFSFNAAVSERWLAILRTFLCPEANWNIRIRKQGYMFMLTDFKEAYNSFKSKFHQKSNILKIFRQISKKSIWLIFLS